MSDQSNVFIVKSCQSRRTTVLTSMRWVGLLSVIVASSAYARQLPDTTLYDVHQKYVEGDVNRFRMEFHTTMDNPRQQGKSMEFYFTTTMKETTKQIASDGAIVLVDAPEEAYIKYGEFEMDATQALPVVTQTRAKDGSIQNFVVKGGDTKVADLATLLQKFAQAPSLLYPPKPVKIGDSWKIFYTDPKAKNMTVTGTASLTGIEIIKGAKSLKIAVVTDTKASDQGDVQMHMQGTGNIDSVTGQFLYMKAAISGTMGKFGKNKSDLVMSHLNPNDKATNDKSGVKAPSVEVGAKP